MFGKTFWIQTQHQSPTHLVHIDLASAISRLTETPKRPAHLQFPRLAKGYSTRSYPEMILGISDCLKEIQFDEHMISLICPETCNKYKYLLNICVLHWLFSFFWGGIPLVSSFQTTKYQELRWNWHEQCRASMPWQSWPHPFMVSRRPEPPTWNNISSFFACFFGGFVFMSHLKGFSHEHILHHNHSTTWFLRFNTRADMGGSIVGFGPDDLCTSP